MALYLSQVVLTSKIRARRKRNRLYPANEAIDKKLVFELSIQLPGVLEGRRGALQPSVLVAESASTN
jgi:hypothetical protein